MTILAHKAVRASRCSIWLCCVKMFYTQYIKSYMLKHYVFTYFPMLSGSTCNEISLMERHVRLWSSGKLSGNLEKFKTGHNVRSKEKQGTFIWIAHFNNQAIQSALQNTKTTEHHSQLKTNIQRIISSNCFKYL